MGKPSVKKRNEVDEDDSNSFAIMFTLINAEKPMTLSEVAKELDIPANLVFYHIKILKKRHLILETGDKQYTCQPIFLEDASEDLDMLMLLMIKIIVREIIIESPTEKTLSKAVIENLRMYLKRFEIEIE